jgi:hypothetical protein
MKYIFWLLNHIVGKFLWLLAIWITLFAMVLMVVFGFLWDFKNHVKESETLELKKIATSFSKYTFTNIANEILKYS